MRCGEFIVEDETQKKKNFGCAVMGLDGKISNLDFTLWGTKKTTQFLNWENINKVLRSVSRKRTHVNYASWFKGRGVWNAFT